MRRKAQDQFCLQDRFARRSRFGYTLYRGVPCVRFHCGSLELAGLKLWWMFLKERQLFWWVRMALYSSWSLSLAMSLRKIGNSGGRWRWPACGKDGVLPRKRVV